jgi:hypothetical protein
MIRALTLVLFLLTPLSAAAAAMFAGPLAAISVAIALPLLAIGVTIVMLQRAPNRATQELAERREDLQKRLSA